MTDDVKIPPLPTCYPDTNPLTGAIEMWFSPDQMHDFYSRGYFHGWNDRAALLAPFTGSPAVEDTLRAPDDAIPPERKPPCVLCAGLDPWPNPGDPVIEDALRAPESKPT